jgi:hypothetical protein
MECQRAKLASIDTRYYAGQPEQARSSLVGLRDVFAAQPPLVAVATGFERVLALLLGPDEATLVAVTEQLATNAKAGALQRRNAVRALLVLSEIFSQRGNADYARRLAQTALDVAGDAIVGEGMDANLLLLWRARLAGEAVPAAALEALIRAIGADHPYIAAHRDR